MTASLMAQLDRRRKLPKYASAGVQHVWLVDPLNRTLEALRWNGEAWVLIDYLDEASPKNGRVRIEPFDAVELDLDALWVPDT